MGPGTGIFRIMSAVESSLAIGVDNTGSPGTQRVVSYGDSTVWYLHEDSGKYKIDLVTNWYSKEEYGNVVVQTPVDPGTRWIITEISPDTFTIESDSIISPNTAWTLTSTERKYPINLEYITALPRLEQQWRFEPIMEFPTAAPFQLPVQPLVYNGHQQRNYDNHPTCNSRNLHWHLRTHGFFSPLNGFGASTTRSYEGGVKLSREGATNGYPCCIFLASKLPILALFPVQSGSGLLPPPPLDEPSPESQHHGAMQPTQNNTWNASTRSVRNVHLAPTFRVDWSSETEVRYREDGAKRRSTKENEAEIEEPRYWRLGALTPGCDDEGGGGSQSCVGLVGSRRKEERKTCLRRIGGQGLGECGRGGLSVLEPSWGNGCGWGVLVGVLSDVMIGFVDCSTRTALRAFLCIHKDVGVVLMRADLPKMRERKLWYWSAGRATAIERVVDTPTQPRPIHKSRRRLQTALGGRRRGVIMTVPIRMYHHEYLVALLAAASMCPTFESRRTSPVCFEITALNFLRILFLNVHYRDAVSKLPDHFAVF
ncbi:hypothetical protein BU15DRAFT_69288 [Melanogaster broomeanus]|nr:hypothetical protein BU15DRAFT_69288 [Melanogaster broomeanus]